MRLLIIFPSTIRGGTEEYALTIASASKKQGWDVHVAFPSVKNTASLVQDFTAEGIFYYPLDIAEVTSPRFKAVREYLPQFLRTIVLLLKLKPDVVQINLPWPYRCLSSILACGFLNISTVVVFHLLPNNVSFTKNRLKAYNWARSRKQQWMTISENNRKLISHIFEIPQDQVLQIYNGTKIISKFSSLFPEEITNLRYQVRQELGLPDTTRLLITVGRLNSQKGYNDIIPTIAPIIEEFAGVKFIWIGEGEQHKYLVKKLKECGLEDNVLFLGYRSDISRLLKAADIFVFPTHFEGLPFAPIEAMAHGLPIVASDASSIPELIEDKVHGLLFPVGNSHELLEAIRWALSHPESMQEMAQKAQMRVQEFSEERMVEKTLHLFKYFTLAC